MSFEESSTAVWFEDDNSAHINDDQFGSKLISMEEGRKIIQSVVHVNKMTENVSQNLQNSPLSPKFYLLMNSSSCLSRSDLLSAQYHEQRLNEVIHISGLKRIPIEGDGNCCFTALAHAVKLLHSNGILSVKQEMENLPLDYTVSPQVMSTKIKQIVYEEWIKFEHEYKEFLLDDEDFVEEAGKFLRNGFFISSLGDTVIKAASNALGMPIIVLTSIDEIPVLKFQPRIFHVHAPLIVAYNQFGAGHYDALSYTTSLSQPSISESEVHAGVNCPNRSSGHKDLMCKCGLNNKKDSMIASCCERLHYSSRCPCLKQATSCCENCRCKNCENKYGRRPTITAVEPTTRRRQVHDLRSTYKSNAKFLVEKHETISKVSWSHHETLLILEVEMFLMQQTDTATTVENIHELYHDLLRLMQMNNIAIAVGSKSLSSIAYKLRQLQKLKQTLSSLFCRSPGTSC